MTPWQEFYQSVRAADWPDCEREQDFSILPVWIQQECIQVHGYAPGEYRQQSSLTHRKFPIKSATACQLKWTWSTVFLTQGTTASCHRTNHHRFDLESFDFHNTPQKLQDRDRMLEGQWPSKGCDYCRQIEAAGGQSDRITNNDMPGINAPPELDRDPRATKVTPRILEVYFDNTCNLKCVYCGPWFSSLWQAENKRHGDFASQGLVIKANWNKDPDIEQNKARLFSWLEQNVQNLTQLNVLGGEPLYQPELEQTLDLFEHHAAPNLDLEIFSNLNTSHAHLERVIGRVHDLISRDRLRNLVITASLDCWGPSQEYARFPLKLEKWYSNFQYLLAQPWIRLVIGSTVTPLTVQTLPDLVQRINQWRSIRPVHHYFNAVNSPSYMFIDMFGDIFQDAFEQALSMMDPADPASNYLRGIARQSASGTINATEVRKLHAFLTEMDRRRGTNWQDAFPWLVKPIFSVVDH